MRKLSIILFFIFSCILFAGTNNIITALSALSSLLPTEMVSAKLKTSLNSIMEEEKSEKNEDIPDGKIIDIICEDIHGIHFFSSSKQADGIPLNERVFSLHHPSIFIPPPNIYQA